ncbi:hypothetical protein [Paracoccus lutimaris]|uniref:YpeB-like protein with protease inhibitory function n=1 Tax=Paracoccus lutimaris TaxID=1490030 RepID=A0A368ZCG9_9RHOB|nr:hypothetical protein [Paracoccus lutimaris]RCW88887.1 hypothetical protein DFP89_101325 [Paracoccus lutimaris]
MSRKLTTSIALTALLAVMGARAMAQDGAPVPPPAASTPAPTVALPQILQDAGLTDVSRDELWRGGTRIQATLPDGAKIGAMLAEDGTLRGLRMQDDAAVLPQSLVDKLVPQAVRDNGVYAQIDKLGAVFTDERGVMLAGTDAQGSEVRAAFAQDGTLIRFGRGDGEMELGKDRGRGRDGKHGHRWHKGGHDDDHGRHDRHGATHDGNRDWEDHDDHDGKREGRRGPPPGDMPPPDMPPPGDMPPPPPAPDQQGAAPMPPVDGEMRQGAATPLSVDPGEMRMALTEAGYSGIGEITQNGPRVLAMATNPEGEPVAVELDPQGEVLREINR